MNKDLIFKITKYVCQNGSTARSNELVMFLHYFFNHFSNKV